ncbi:hypothetical protein [Vibrio crassostreae]|uniref:hypothetical protein n=1 Tax=Vibrio crassostreae TaxID=246167 RepID=UPI001B315974|nr:hypothetical protein [Vibrio crassostreae]
MDKERKCIELSINIELEYLRGKTGFQEYSPSLLSYIATIKEIWTELSPKDTALKRLLFIIILILLVAFLPAAAICLLLMEAHRNAVLALEIWRLKRFTITPLPPEEKTLSNLWHYHGFEHISISHEVCIQLVQERIDLLYGNSVAEKFDLNEMLLQKHTIAARLNSSSYKEGTPLIHFNIDNKLRAVIREISSELALYV